MWANPFLQGHSKGRPWKSRLFWALKWQRPKRVPFGKDFQSPTPPMAQVMDLPLSKSLSPNAIQKNMYSTLVIFYTWVLLQLCRYWYGGGGVSGCHFQGPPLPMALEMDCLHGGGGERYKVYLLRTAHPPPARCHFRAQKVSIFRAHPFQWTNNGFAAIKGRQLNANRNQQRYVKCMRYEIRLRYIKNTYKIQEMFDVVNNCNRTNLTDENLNLNIC